MSHIHFIESPIRAGKSTYAKAVAEKGSFSHIALDDWFTRLFSPDRPHMSMFVPLSALKVMAKTAVKANASPKCRWSAGYLER